MSWHVEDTLLAAYAANALDDPRSSSIEAHLLGCTRCRERLASRADVVQLDRVWAAVTETIDAPSIGVVERTLLALGVREHVARLLAATPSLRLSWLIAEAIALGFAVVAANAASADQTEEAAILLFLIVAALLPVGGVAAAYGRGVDPTYEIGMAAPMRSARLLLVRATAVLGTCIVIASVASLALPGPAWSTIAWLLPSLALTLITLALSTYVRPVLAASAVAVSWVLIAAGAAYRSGDELAPFRGGAQVFFVLVIAIAASLLVQRRSAIEQGVTG